MFIIDPILEEDSTSVLDLKLCNVRLSNNAAFPWIILIPKYNAVYEIIDLNKSDQLLLMTEISLTSLVVKHLFQPTKLNIATLGNIVPQLHVHVIARYNADPAWPGSVWGSGVGSAYDPKIQAERVANIRAEFKR